MSDYDDYGDDRQNGIGEQEYKEHIADLQKQFTEFLYNNYTIGNGEQLIHILEQGDALEAFLELKGLPADTEIEI